MKSNKLLTSSMNYGAITALVSIAYSLILYITGQTLNQTLGTLSIVIFAACIYIFTKQYRDNVQNGTLTYGEGFQIGLLTGIFASIIISFFVYIEVIFIDPTIIDKQLEIAQENMLKRGIPEEQMEQAIEITKKFMTPVWMAVLSILQLTFFSTIISLITAAILKKQPNPFENIKQE